MNALKLFISLVLFSWMLQTPLAAQKLAHKYIKLPIDTYCPSDFCDEELETFYKHEKVYIIEKPFEDVWNIYALLDAKTAWDTRRAKYIMSYDTNEEQFNFFNQQNEDTVRVGKTYVLQLRFMKVIKMPVVFQISKIDEEEQIIEFTYMEENKTKGIQTLKFFDADGETHILHTSYYSSGKKMRDKKLYPHFHELATDDFHKRLMAIINNWEEFFSMQDAH